MAKDSTHRLLSVTWAIVLPSPYRFLSMPSLHCFVELRAFQWQESSFFFNSTAWSGTDAKTFLELAVFPSGRPAHSAVVFSIFNHPLFSKPARCTCEEGKWGNWVKYVSKHSYVVVCLHGVQRKHMTPAMKPAFSRLPDSPTDGSVNPYISSGQPLRSTWSWWFRHRFSSLTEYREKCKTHVFLSQTLVQIQMLIKRQLLAGPK